jgi:hypothetical protein
MIGKWLNDELVARALFCFSVGAAEGVGLGLGTCGGGLCANAGAESAASAQANEAARRTDGWRDVLSFKTVPKRSCKVAWPTRFAFRDNPFLVMRKKIQHRTVML